MGKMMSRETGVPGIGCPRPSNSGSRADINSQFLAAHAEPLSSPPPAERQQWPGMSKAIYKKQPEEVWKRERNG